MVDSGDHLTPKLGLSPSVLISKNGGPFATPAGTIAEVSLGWYLVSGHVTDTNTLGPLMIHASGSGADMYDGLHEVVLFNPRDSISLGLTNVFANVASWSGTVLPNAASDANKFPKVDIVAISGNVLPNVVTNGYMPIDWGSIGGKTLTVDFPNTSISGIVTYQGNTKQTGDSFARIGSGGSSLTEMFVNVSGINLGVKNVLVDSIFTRGGASWEASASGTTLGAVVSQSLNSAVNGNVLEIKKTDNSLLMTKALTKNSDNPIRSIT